MNTPDRPDPAGRKPLIFVYGDSMSMPSHPEGVEPQDTMAELLSAHYAAAGRPALLYNRSESGNTIMDHWSKYKDDAVLFGVGRRDVLIFCAGVVDCAPRPLPPRLRRKLERKPAFIRRPIIKFLKENRPMLLRWGISYRKVEPAAFAPRLKEWLADAIKRFGQIAVVELPPVNTAAEEHSPGWQASIVLYNQILAEAVASLDDPRIFMVPLHQWLLCRRDHLDTYISPTDGHHLLKAGHLAAFHLLRDALKLESFS
jgi:hypothetical protein